MRPFELAACAITGFAALLLGGCASQSSSQSGAAGSAGSDLANGGSVGTGGATSTGGATNTGGRANTGGAPNTGGRAGTGGATNTGGRAGTGGATNTGGSVGTGGTPSTVAACDALPAAGTWEEITPHGVATSDALTLDPFTAGTLWFGADPIGGGTPGLGGVFKSTDCGATWSHVNSGTNGSQIDNAHIWSMAVDFVDPGVLYVVGAYGPQGLWKSTNGGVDWKQLFPADSEFAKTVSYNWASSVSMDPTDHLHLVVGTHDNCSGAYAPTCGAETTDGGATWKLFRTTFLSSWAEQTGPYVLNTTSWLYATVFNGLWLTTDRGANWKQVSNVGGASAGEYTHRPIWRGTDGTYYLPAFNPGGVMRSTDGRTWSLLAGSSSGSYPMALAVGGGNLYLGDFYGWNYLTASESAPTKWSKLPIPSGAGSGKQGPVFLEYDEAHHILYSSNFTGGVWRLVTP